MFANNDNRIGAKKDSGVNKKQECTGNNIEAALHPIIIVKNARVQARAEVRSSQCNPGGLCGDWDRNRYPRRVSDSIKSGREMTYFKYGGRR